MVFADPWAGGSFAVSRVGESYEYFCEEGAEPPSELCQGPYGDLVLDGTYTEEGADPIHRFAIFTVSKAAPCCDWNVTDPADTDLGENFKWLDPAEVPRLGEQGFLSIDSQYGEDFGNPLIAVACTLR